MSGSTTNYKLIQPTVSGDSDVWGGYLNTALASIDKLQTAIATTGSANAYVLTSGQSLTAYTTGMAFRINPNFTCTGAATLNVDAIGAKNIKKNNGGSLVSIDAGDLTSGMPIVVVYDGTQFVIQGVSSALLAAIDALAWTAGTPVLQWTAADTVSLTNTPTFKNQTDSASVTALTIGGKRATPTAFDNVALNFELNNGAGTAKVYGNILTYAAVVTAGSESGRMDLQLMNGSGTLTGYLTLVPTALRPVTNDGLALGSATLSFADIFLASGGVINWNNGNYTLTHSSGLLSASGAIQARVPVSTETTGTLTTASANKKVVCTGNITIPNSVFTADDAIQFDPGTSARTFTRGTTNMYVNGTDAASATLAANQLGSVIFRSATVAICSGAFT